jgi:hypothetical protein
MRSMAALALLAACTASQARTAHHVGEIATAGGLLALLGCVTVAEAWPSEAQTTLEVGLVFVPISIIGALTYAATDDMVSHTAPETHSDHARDTAMDLAKQAKHAARAGDCAQVLAIEPRVAALDAGISRRFHHDAVIATCLSKPAAPPPADIPPPDQPPP